MTKRKTVLRLVSMITAFVLCIVGVPYVPKQADVIAAGVVDGANVGITIASSAQAEALINVALAEEGYKAGSNRDNKYGKWYGANNVDWCAIFISWCANQAGIPTSIIKKNAWQEIWNNHKEQATLEVNIIQRVL